MLLANARSDVMFAHCAEGTTSFTQWTSLPKATSLALGGKHRLACSPLRITRIWPLFLLVMFLLTQKWCYATHNDVARKCSQWCDVCPLCRRHNIIHAVNITAEGNITCPGGQTSFSVFSVKDNTLRLSRPFSPLWNMTATLFHP